MSGRTWLASIALITAASSCGYGVTPPPRDPPDADWTAGGAAVMNVKGVRLLARGGAWRGTPANLGADVTPIEVRIENASGKPIRVLYERFALVAGDGRTFYPLPLLPLAAGTAKMPAVQPAYADDHFFVAPRLRTAYVTLPVWGHTLPQDESLYRLDYQKWNQHLPTPNIIDEGLPEGVLANGGTVSGFLYFDGEARGEHDLVFQADVEDSDGDARVALITIPFRLS